MLTDSAIPSSLRPPNLVEGEGFEPSKAVPSDLQSDPFDRSGTPPNKTTHYECIILISQRDPRPYLTSYTVADIYKKDRNKCAECEIKSKRI